MKSNTHKKMINSVMSELKDKLEVYTQPSLDNSVGSVCSNQKHAFCVDMFCNCNVYLKWMHYR